MLLKGIFNWFVQPDYGPAGGVQPHRKKGLHVHQWEFSSRIRHGWKVEAGRPVGERIAIDRAIIDVQRDPSKNETRISSLRDWKKSGYKFVHTSATIYKCKVCNQTNQVDFYAAPVKGDGSGPLVIDLTNVVARSSFQKTFADTSRITVINSTRREIAIEPMKRYGARPKSSKSAPVVPIES